MWIKSAAEWLTETFTNLDCPDSIKALNFAIQKHEGQFRKPVDKKEPYVRHPITMALHACVLGVRSDHVFSAILLHDVLEDCPGVTLEDLPCSDTAKELVKLLTKPKRGYSADKYYAAIAANPTASLIKCLDRIDNLSGMAEGFKSKEKIQKYVAETDKYYDKLIQAMDSRDDPLYHTLAWECDYEIMGLVSTAKRI